MRVGDLLAWKAHLVRVGDLLAWKAHLVRVGDLLEWKADDEAAEAAEAAGAGLLSFPKPKTHSELVPQMDHSVFVIAPSVLESDQ